MQHPAAASCKGLTTSIPRQQQLHGCSSVDVYSLKCLSLKELSIAHALQTSLACLLLCVHLHCLSALLVLSLHSRSSLASLLWSRLPQLLLLLLLLLCFTTMPAGHVSTLLSDRCPLQLAEWANSYGPVYKLQLLNHACVILTDPAAAHDLIRWGSSDSYIGKTRDLYRALELGTEPKMPNVLTSPDDAYWKAVRQATAPCFSISNLKQVGILSSCHILVSHDVHSRVCHAWFAVQVLMRGTWSGNACLCCCCGGCLERCAWCTGICSVEW
jgi:hypothetical protein